MKNPFVVSILAAAVGLAHAALPDTAAAQTASDRTASDGTAAASLQPAPIPLLPAGKLEADLASKLTGMTADEEARVIIEFAMPSTARPGVGDSDVFGSVRRIDQRNAVAAGREALLQSPALATLSDELRDGVKRTYDYTPMIAYEGSRSEIEAFARSANVSRIFEDKPVPLALATSTNRINAPSVWAAGFDGSGQAVAILDTGVDASHSHFGGRVVAEACFSTNSSFYSATTVCPNGLQTQIGAGAGDHCSLSIPGCDHGTHVAGIAAADDPFSAADGVAKGASIIAVQVFTRFNNPSVCGSSTPCILSFQSDQIAGLDYVLSLTGSLNVASVNMSLGGGRYFSPCSGQPQETSINNLKAAGVAVIAASGNNGYVDSIGAPACIPNAISVGSTTSTTDQVSSFTNSASFLDLLAPGQVITAPIPNNLIGNKSGTSMATPHVAGAYAVLREVQPSLTVDQITNVLASTGAPIFDPGNGLVKPRIDLLGAYNSVIASP